MLLNELYPNLTNDYVMFGSLLSQIRLSVCNVRAPYFRGLKLLAIFLRHFVP